MKTKQIFYSTRVILFICPSNIGAGFCLELGEPLHLVSTETGFNRHSQSSAVGPATRSSLTEG
jgi:hypothetical protein